MLAKIAPALCLLLFSVVAEAASNVASCPSDALGTARVLTVDRSVLRVGRKHFPATLPLAPREVVLTFDDGPWPGTTPRVLDALARECVRATFFLIGRNASAHPHLVKREIADGHTVAHHTFAHPLLAPMRLEAAMAEIDRGIAAVETAAFGRTATRPTTPFFRFPGFASSPALLDHLAARGITVFGADLWASDWVVMRPEEELTLVLSRLAAVGGGIILFHDTKAQTAAMLPAFLRALKAGGYKVVHVVPAGPAVALR
jgi:peptidoglycan/xylan/chitin deacetylase (PgdA/CDA1 family)